MFETMFENSLKKHSPCIILIDEKSMLLDCPARAGLGRGVNDKELVNKRLITNVLLKYGRST